MLQHQQQPTFNTCMATCVAMVAGQPVDEVVARWHQAFHDKTDWLDDALDYYKIPYFYGSHRIQASSNVTSGKSPSRSTRHSSALHLSCSSVASRLSEVPRLSLIRFPPGVE
jgi:hypothetical protein